MKDVLEKLHRLLTEKHIHIATAESCTGGLISAACTMLPGSSAYMNGGVVTYTNAMKEKCLGIASEWLSTYGAVNEETARMMVIGVVRLYDADYGVATTGFAGPEGGDDQNPVGTVYIAVGNQQWQRVRKVKLPGTRKAVRTAATNQAIQLLYEVIYEMEEEM